MREENIGRGLAFDTSECVVIPRKLALLSAEFGPVKFASHCTGQG